MSKLFYRGFENSAANDNVEGAVAAHPLVYRGVRYDAKKERNEKTGTNTRLFYRGAAA